MSIQDTIPKTRPDSHFCAHQQVLAFCSGERVGISLSPEPTTRQLCPPHPLLSPPTPVQGSVWLSTHFHNHMNVSVLLR